MNPFLSFIHTRSVPSLDNAASWKPPGMIPKDNP